MPELTLTLTAPSQCTLLTLVSTMKDVAVTSCWTRSPAYEIARPLRHDMAIIT